MEDSDCLCLDSSVPEEEGSESLLAACEMGEEDRGQREDGEKHKKVKVAINGNQLEEIENRNNFKEVKFEEERKRDQEKGVILGEEPVKETSEKQEGLNEKSKDERNQSEEVAEGQEIESETNKMQKGVAREEEGKENQEEKDKDLTGSLNKLIKRKPHDPNTVAEPQGQEETANPETPASPGPQSLAADPKPTAGQEKRSEEAVKKEERGIRENPSPPKVLSAVAHFQSQASSQSSQVKSRVKGLAEPERPCNVLWSRDNTQTPPCDSNISEENNLSEAHEEEDSPPIKVSELKKRFEA